MFIKTIHKAMILSLASLAVTQLNASAAKPAAQNEKPESKPVTVSGVLESNAQGKLECEVTYNPAAGGSYTGKIYNKGFSMACWYDRTLDQNEAQTYYNQFQAAQIKAAADQKQQKK